MNRFIFSAPAILIALTQASEMPAQEPANPVVFSLSCSMAAAQQTCTSQVALPAGKRIVIEHVSARLIAPSGQTVQLYVSTSAFNLPSGTVAARHFVPFTPAPSGSHYFANFPIRMYGTTGSSVSIHSQRLQSPAGAPGSVQLEVWFTGYLLP